MATAPAAAAATAAPVTADSAAPPRDLPFWFEENRGQFSQGTDFAARVHNELLEVSPTSARFAGVAMQAVGGHADARVIDAKPLETRVSYFYGSDQSKWIGGAATYAQVRYDDVYPGIDVVYHGTNAQLEYDFIVEPQRDPSAIRLGFSGVEGLRIDDNGDLVLTSAAGDVRHHAPYAYQEKDGKRETVPARFRIEKDVVTFELASYDRDRALVIDPVLTSSRFLYFSDEDRLHGFEIDAAGNMYVMGVARRPPASSALGYWNSVTNAIYVAKYNSTTTTPIFVAYIGADWLTFSKIRGFSIDPAGNIYIAGVTPATTYPTTAGAFQEEVEPLQSGPIVGWGFITKVNAAGNALVYSTYFGIGASAVEDIVADADGNAYVTGAAAIPVTDGQLNTRGGKTAIVKFGPTGSLLWSARAGGTGGTTIMLDPAGNILVGGTAPYNSPFATTAGALFMEPNERRDTFVLKLNPAGTAPIFATRFYGESVVDMDLGSDGSIYLLGKDGFNNDNPATDAGWDVTPSPFTDIYVARLSQSGSTLVSASLLGGEGNDDPFSIHVATDGTVFVSGTAGSSDFPAVEELQTERASSLAWFITRFSDTLHDVTFSTQLGPGNGAFIGKATAEEVIVAGTGLRAYWTRSHPLPPGMPRILYAQSAIARINLLGTQPFAIDVVYPYGGSTDGDTLVVRGHGFQQGATLHLGDTQLTTRITPDGTYAIAQYAPMPAGNYRVSIKNPGGATADAAADFIISPRPIVDSIVPSSGPADGVAVTITGTNLHQNARVDVDAVGPCTLIERTAHTIRCTMPVRLGVSSTSGATHAVVVRNPDGQESRTNFTYTEGAGLSVSSVSPSEASALGGTLVTITGTGFQHGVRVAVGNSWARQVTRISDTQLQIVTPATRPTKTLTVYTPAQNFALGGLLVRGITRMTPAQGGVSGGTRVRLDGYGLRAGDAVLFGGVPGTDVVLTTIGSEPYLSATAPPHAAGPVVVTVTGDHETYTAPYPFLYEEQPPTITSVTPSAVNGAGATITINGANFLAGAKVQFGSSGQSATDVVVVSGTAITCKVPALPIGVHGVVVENPDGQIATRSNALTVNGIGTVTPSRGRPGDVVSITGFGYESGAVVRFDGVIAATTFNHSQSLTATVPDHAAGLVAVSVTLPNGTSFTKAGAFRYLLPAATISTVSPNNGLPAGGTAITITGTNFVSGSKVLVGAKAATDVAFVNSTTLTAKTPAYNAGTYVVKVVLPDDQEVTKTDAFTYSAGPGISSVSPATGPVEGGTLVTIQGSSFRTGAAVTFGGTPGTNVTVVSTSQITVTTPAHAAGPVDVVVTNPDTQSVTRTEGFRYLLPPPQITSFSPMTGSPGTVVTLTGVNFTGATSVKFNGSAATFTVESATSISTVVPASVTDGPISVTTPNGTATSSSPFTVAATPTIVSFTPASGASGVEVTITGTNFEGTNSVRFNNVAAAFTIVNATSIKATVPATATTGKITVTNALGTGVSANNFFVPAVLSSFSPQSGAPGTIITISGNNFVGVTGVTFNGATATFTVDSQTQITAAVPAGATTGKLTVTTPHGPVSSALSFTVLSASTPSVTARTTAPGAITITWTGDPTHVYEIRRILKKTDSFAANVLTRVSNTNTFVDTSLVAGNAYLYNIKNITTNQTGNYDYALAMTFSDDRIGASTRIRVVHMTELRQAVNALRVAGALATVTWTDPTITVGMAMKPVHITELRTALNAALLSLNRYATFTDSKIESGMVVRGAHVQEMREALK